MSLNIMRVKLSPSGLLKDTIMIYQKFKGFSKSPFLRDTEIRTSWLPDLYVSALLSFIYPLENQYIINCNCPVFYITCTEYCYFTEKGIIVKYRSIFLCVYAYIYKDKDMHLKELYEKFPQTQFTSEYVSCFLPNHFNWFILM